MERLAKSPRSWCSAWEAGTAPPRAWCAAASATHAGGLRHRVRHQRQPAAPRHREDGGQAQGGADGAALWEINPDAHVEGLREFYRDETQPRPGSYDYVVDAIDNVKAKLHPAAPVRQPGDSRGELHGRGGPPGPHRHPRGGPVRDAHGPLRQGHPQAAQAQVRGAHRAAHGHHRRTPSSSGASPVPCATTRTTASRACPNDNDFHSCEHRNQIDGSVAFVTSVFGMNAAGVVRRLSLGE